MERPGLLKALCRQSFIFCLWYANWGYKSLDFEQSNKFWPSLALHFIQLLCKSICAFSGCKSYFDAILVRSVERAARGVLYFYLHIIDLSSICLKKIQCNGYIFLSICFLFDSTKVSNHKNLCSRHQTGLFKLGTYIAIDPNLKKLIIYLKKFA